MVGGQRCCDTPQRLPSRCGAAFSTLESGLVRVCDLFGPRRWVGVTLQILSLRVTSLVAPGDPAPRDHASKPKLAFRVPTDTWPKSPLPPQAMTGPSQTGERGKR